MLVFADSFSTIKRRDPPCRLLAGTGRRCRPFL